MKITPILGSALLVLATMACTQKTETNSTVGETGTVQSSTTTITTPAIDTAAAAQSVQDAAHNTGTAIDNAAHNTATAVHEAGHDAADAGRSAAHATGTALEKAGKSIQRHAKPGDQH